MKKRTTKILKPLTAVAGVCALGLPGAHAQSVTPIFSETFPASWNGTGTTVANQDTSSSAVGFQSGAATYSTTAVPPGAAGGTGSMVLAGAGGTKVTPTASLANASVAADGGFTYNVDFLWNGSTTSFSSQKIVDYAGTESLELDGITAGTSATLDMTFANDTGVESTPISTLILPNTWYDVTMVFNTVGNSLVSGDISGIASLYVNGALVSSAPATKGTYGDTLNRPIAIGELAYGHTTSIVGLDGDIYSASIDLGAAPVPEPAPTALVAMIGGLAMAWNLRRRKK